MKTNYQFKTYYYLVLFLLSSTFITAQKDFYSHNFNNGNLGPFNECTSKSPNYSRVVGKRIKTFWTESGYRGNRTTRGTEVCNDDLTSTKETWMGFTMNIAKSHRNDTESGVAQIFQFVDKSNIFTWTGMLKYEDGDLTIVHRSSKNRSSQVDATVYRNFPRNRDMRIVIHYILSAKKKGKMEIWVNGDRRYIADKINFGFGTWRRDVQTDDTYVHLKIGQYNYDDSNYKRGEERIIYYDDVSWYNGGREGFNKVKGKNGNGGGSNNSNTVHLRKRNSNRFALDGGRGGSNGRNVYLYNQDSNNKNQQWIEIGRGGNHYSYQKRGTNFCLDGGRGGAKGQNVYLWKCDGNNRNQHWKKVNAGSGHYRLQKRNAPSYSIDGGTGGKNRQNLYLWTSSNSNRNQQWFFGKSGSSISEVQKGGTGETEENLDTFSVYPNPVENELNIKFNNYDEETSIMLFSVDGQKIIEAKASNDLKLDISELNIGIYVLRVTNSSETFIKKIVKK